MSDSVHVNGCICERCQMVGFRVPTKNELREAIDKAHDAEVAKLKSDLARLTAENAELRNERDALKAEQLTKGFGIKGLKPVPPESLIEYEQAMDKAIPEIIAAVQRREQLAAESRQRTMGTSELSWKDKHDTEQTMHAAWRKRAEEAESDAATLRRTLEMAVGHLQKCLDLVDGDISEENQRCFSNAADWLASLPEPKEQTGYERTTEKSTV